MTFTEAISIRIKELLKSNNMNINKLAIHAGINESTIRSILNKSTNCPKASTIYYICIGFGISISEFYNSKLFDESNIIDN